jgi:hypothetical protein
MLVILATREAEMRRIMVQRQPWQVVSKTLSQKNSSRKRAGGVAQGSNPSTAKQTNKQTNK